MPELFPHLGFVNFFNMTYRTTPSGLSLIFHGKTSGAASRRGMIGAARKEARWRPDRPPALLERKGDVLIRFKFESVDGNV
jgi:hypothetical protein